MCLTLQGDDDDDEYEDSIDPQELAAEEAAGKERKKAGIPEIHVDALNSSAAPKFLTLSPKKVQALAHNSYC